MGKVTAIEQTDAFGNVTEIVNIENEDGSVTSMLKSFYDQQQAANEAKTI